MRIVFFGSGKIAVKSLEALIKNKYEVICVVTAPDKQKGRGLAIASTPIKDFAKKEDLDIIQPSNLNSIETAGYISALNPDIFVVFSYGKILPKTILDIPKVMPINIHASLLPKYRGAAPINWALINGEKETGISIMRMNERMDAGDIVLKEKVQIDESDTYLSLEEKLSKLGANLIIESLELIKGQRIKFLKQDNENASYAPKLKKVDGKINWNKKACEIFNQIRGCLPWPGSFTTYNDKIVKILAAEVVKISPEIKFKPGAIISLTKEGILVAAKEGGLLIKELQQSSGKRLNAWQFIQGHKLEQGLLFI